MRQRLGVPANVAPNTRRTQFINHANYKIIYLNVIDWANATKIHTPPSAKHYFPPWRACAVRRQCLDRKEQDLERHWRHRTWARAGWKCAVRVLWTQNTSAWSAKYQFVTSVLFANKSTVKHATRSSSCRLWYTDLRAVCNALLLCLFFAINCQSKASRALCSGISLTTTSIN